MLPIFEDFMMRSFLKMSVQTSKKLSYNKPEF